MLKNILVLFSGLLFGCGLIVSGMADVDNVIGFLDIFGNWQPNLILVMAGALVTTAIGYQFIFKKSKPLYSEHYHLPKKKQIDAPLVIGASCFGVGWGLVGYCPGPAIASLGNLDVQTLLFVFAMFFGMMVSHQLQKVAFNDEN
ncbi:YeeE/YedE family protein [Catenovulum sp. SM1970]|uniref:YeeE/YedE family protein n=1 Tax=Marinifaba aquimaris TaxID=2741323 RepID=UPI001574E456|nr:YeeE/YedE family protein [Marinifaba aquimaris]NTS76492.1 YeeE/YedE family protein [Marinifaba aquimaris]